RLLPADIQPLFLVPRQFFRRELAAPWVLIVVTVDLCVAVEAHWNRVADAVVAALSSGPDVVSLNLDTTEAMADAAPPVAGSQQSRNFIAVEGHRRSLPIRSSTFLKPFGLRLGSPAAGEQEGRHGGRDDIQRPGEPGVCTHPPF